MIRFLLRLMGFGLLAISAALVIVDGTRSIAANAILPTTLGQTLAWLFPLRFPVWQAQLSAILPTWGSDMLIAPVLQIPTALVLVGLAAGLLLVARSPAQEIGFVIER